MHSSYVNRDGEVSGRSGPERCSEERYKELNYVDVIIRGGWFLFLFLSACHVPDFEITDWVKDKR
jgi:hypothetical protein